MVRSKIAIFESPEATEGLLLLMTLDELADWLEQHPKGQFFWMI